MNRSEHRIESLQQSMSALCGSASQLHLEKEFSPMLSELPQQVRAEADKFVGLTGKVLGRLNDIANRVCKAFLKELIYSPEAYDKLSVHHLDLLARKIGQEVDALYKCLMITSIDIIGSSYEMWVRESSLEKQQLIETA